MHCIPDGRSLSSRKENLYLGTFHFRFMFGKRLTVNVFRQRINQLFQSFGDIWRAIAFTADSFVMKYIIASSSLAGWGAGCGYCTS
ncbi:MAG: hypothetical protein KGR70_13165 [Cyanobacteria bacterium REEB494]|nr:hypothetical protein [Cyanobacteria bacterium REEB494]